MARTHVKLRPHDRVRLLTSIKPVFNKSVDLICTIPGIHVSYSNPSTGIFVRSSTDLWITDYTANLFTLAAEDAAPTLAVDRFDNLYCFWHTGDVPPFNVIGRKSRDWGHSWHAWGPSPTIFDFKFPRACCAIEAQFMAMHNGSSVEIFRSVDFFKTLSPTTSLFTQACPLQLVDLCVDRRDVLHLIYQDSSNNIWQRLSKDGQTWRNPVILDGGASFPSGVFLNPKGNLLCFEGPSDPGPVKRRQIKSTYEENEGTSIDTGLRFPLQYMGLHQDRRDNMWLAAQQASGKLWVGYSNTYGEPWHAKVS